MRLLTLKAVKLLQGFRGNNSLYGPENEKPFKVERREQKTVKTWNERERGERRQHDFYVLQRCGAGGRTGDRGVKICNERMCFISDTAVNDFNDEYELDTGSALSKL